MIVDSAASHLAQGELNHVERGRLFIPQPISKQEIEHSWTRKFRSRSESALFGIVTGCQLTVPILEPIKLQRARFDRLRLPEMGFDRLSELQALIQDLAGTVLPDFSYTS